MYSIVLVKATIIKFIYIGHPIYNMASRSEDESCCDMRGMLSFLILFLLSKKPMCGKAIANELEKRKEERPSPGTIYPALKNLKESGLIIDEAGKDGKTINYKLSNEGKRVLKVSKRRFARTFGDVI